VSALRVALFRWWARLGKGSPSKRWDAPPAWPRGPVLVRVCAWCQIVMGVAAAGETQRTALTHGICEECNRRMKP
jgi:hypothetical protein